MCILPPRINPPLNYTAFLRNLRYKTPSLACPWRPFRLLAWLEDIMLCLERVAVEPSSHKAIRHSDGEKAERKRMNLNNRFIKYECS